MSARCGGGGRGARSCGRSRWPRVGVGAGGRRPRRRSCAAAIASLISSTTDSPLGSQRVNNIISFSLLSYVQQPNAAACHRSSSCGCCASPSFSSSLSLPQAACGDASPSSCFARGTSAGAPSAAPAGTQPPPPARTCQPQRHRVSDAAQRGRSLASGRVDLRSVGRNVGLPSSGRLCARCSNPRMIGVVGAAISVSVCGSLP